MAKLSEQHPREQGLKLVSSGFLLSFSISFRATSKRTRIETTSQRHQQNSTFRFQSNIQENKD